MKTVLQIGLCLLLGNVADAQTFELESEETLKVIVMIDGQILGTPVFGAGIVFRRERDRLFIVTANHVVRRGMATASNIRVRLRGTAPRTLPATLLPEADAEQDIAFLSVDKLTVKDLDVCTLRFDRAADIRALKRGDDVFPVGNPNGAEWAIPVSADRISSLNGDQITFQSAFIAVGVSGGGLLNKDGHLVGMVLRDEPPYGQAIRLSTVLQTARRWYSPQLFVWDEDGSTPLHEAAENGDVRLIGALLASACSDVNAKAYIGTPLSAAVKAKKSEAVRLLLDSGAKLDSWVLPDAARHGDLATVKLLLQHGANINSGARESPLRAAIDSGNAAVVAEVLQAGAQVEGQHLLEAAAEAENPEVLRKLLATAASSEVRDPAVMEKAIERGRVEAVRLLIAAGAGVNAKTIRNTDETLLHIAAQKGQTDIIRLLLQAGADMNVVHSKYTPLMDAVRYVHPEAVKLLLDEGADIDFPKTGDALCEADGDRRTYRGWEKLKDAWSRAQGSAAWEIFQLLIQRSGSALDRLAAACGVFDRAAAEGDMQTIKALLAAGASPNAPDVNPLIAAASPGQVDVARALVEARIDLNRIDRNGYTALHTALHATFSQYGGGPEARMQTARFLLSAGARVNTRVGYSGATPLHDAIIVHAPVDILQLMLRAGANVSAPDNHGETPLMLAHQIDPSVEALLIPYRHSQQQKSPEQRRD